MSMFFALGLLGSANMAAAYTGVTKAWETLLQRVHGALGPGGRLVTTMWLVTFFYDYYMAAAAVIYLFLDIGARGSLPSWVDGAGGIQASDFGRFRMGWCWASSGDLGSVIPPLCVMYSLLCYVDLGYMVNFWRRF
jgi:hypothetical protein